MFYALSYKIGESASESYGTSFNDLDTLIKDGYMWGRSLIDEAIRQALDVLTENRIYDVDHDFFCKTYFNNYNHWDESFSKIEEKYLELISEKADIEQYHSYRKASRDKYYGYNTDTKIDAFAKNMATGIAHSIWNLAADGVASMALASKKKNIFENPQTKKTIILGIENAVFKTHYALINALNDKLNANILSNIPLENREKAKRLLNTLNTGRVKKEDVDKVALELIVTDPYNPDVYKYFLDNFPNESKSIAAIADCFGVDVLGEKKEMVEAFYKQLDFSDESRCIESKEKLLRYLSSLDFEDTGGYIKRIDDKITQKRTYNGTVYGTAEEANNARELDLIHQRELESRAFAGKTYNTVEEAEEAKKIALEIQDRTCNGVLYGTAEEALKAKEDAAKSEEEAIKKKQGTPMHKFLVYFLILFPYGFVFGLILMMSGKPVVKAQAKSIVIYNLLIYIALLIVANL